MDTAVRLLSSYRFRRRLAWTAGFLAVVSLIGLVFILYNPSDAEISNAPFSNEPAYIPSTPKPVRMTAARRETADRTIDAFVRSAVLRQDTAASYDLVTPTLRDGITRKEWASGATPIVPYPPEDYRLSSWRMVYSFRDLLGVDVMVMPKLHSDGAIAIYSAELKASGRGEHRRWLVDYWLPRKIIGGGTEEPAAAAGKQKGKGQAASPVSQEAPWYEEGRLGARWLLIPAGIFALALLAAIGATFVGPRLRRR